MDRHQSTPSFGDVMGELMGFAAGGGILTTVLFPFALPLLLLVVVPLAVIPVVAAVLVAPVVLIVRLARRTLTGSRGRPEPGRPRTRISRPGRGRAPLASRGFASRAS